MRRKGPERASGLIPAASTSAHIAASKQVGPREGPSVHSTEAGPLLSGPPSQMQLASVPAIASPEAQVVPTESVEVVSTVMADAPAMPVDTPVARLRRYLAFKAADQANATRLHR